MMFSWFSAREAKQFGASLAAFYIGQMPVDLRLSDKKFAAKSESTLRNMADKTRTFKAVRPLNGYQKAQLGNTFKWAMRDAGYDAAHVDRMTDWLVTQL